MTEVGQRNRRRQRGHGDRSRWTQAALCGILLVTGAGMGVSTAAAQEKAATTADDPQRQLLRQALFQVLTQSRPLQNSLLLAERKLAERQPADALAAIQWILDRPEDLFQWRSETTDIPESARGAAARLLAAASPQVRELYDQLYGGAAAQHLKEALRANHRGQVAEVYRRWFYTPAGRMAGAWLAQDAADRGQFEQAGWYWQQLLQDPRHQRQLSRLQLLQAAEALGRSRRFEESQAALTAAGWTTAKGGPPAAWLTTLKVRGDGPPRDMAMVEGQPSRRLLATGSMPLLTPRWSQPLFRGEAAPLQEAVKFWEDQQHLNGLPLASSWVPLVVDGTVIFRDGNGVRAVRLADGRDQWEYRGQSRLMDALPENISENRMSGVPVRELIIANTVLGTLSADRQRVYAVDGVEVGPEGILAARSGQRPAPADVGTQEQRRGSQIVALDLKTGAPVWRVGTMGTAAASPGPLEGHYFLGPPLPMDGVLYAMTELAAQVNLVALRAEDGQLLWSQALALSPSGVYEEPIGSVRGVTACLPAAAHGRIVCPTQLGVLICVEAATGQLAWLYPYLEAEITAGSRPVGMIHRSSLQSGHPGFLETPVIAGKDLLHLPRDSKWLHCVDLATGRRRWLAPREDAEYVAAVTDQIVMVVGTQVCRGLSRETGMPIWSTSCGVPTGRGVRFGDRYLVPLEDGGLADLDLLTGRQMAIVKARNDIPLGNLVAYGDRIVSQGSQQIFAFPQSAALLKEVLATAPSARSPQRHLQAGELQLQLGELEEAKASLRLALGGALPEPARLTAAGLLRETLILQLRNGANDPESLLEELGDLTVEPWHAAENPLLKAEYLLAQGDTTGAFEVAQGALALKAREPLTQPSDARRQMAAAVWVADLVERLKVAASSDKAARELAGRIDADLQAAIVTGDPQLLEGMLIAYARWPQAEAAREALARLRIADREFQAAELLLIQNLSSAREPIAAEAARQLVELWDRQGAYNEAGGMLRQLAERFSQVRLADGRTGGEYAAAYPKQSIAWFASRQLIPPEAPITEVRFQIEPTQEPWLQKSYSNFNQRLTAPGTSDFEVLERGRHRANNGEIRGDLVQIDRETGRIVGQYDVAAFSSLAAPSRGDCRNLIPLAGQNALLGLSLLEKGIAWETVPAGMDRRPEVTRVGPCGPGFMAFQVGNQLLVLDPGTGRILWQREGLEARSGLHADATTGLIGDDQALVLFGTDRSSYTVFRTSNGEELRRGTLKINTRTFRLSFGRTLLFMTEDGNDPQLQLWDALYDRLLFSESFSGRWYVPVMFRDEFVVALPNGRVRILDGRTGAVQMDLMLNPDEFQNTSYIRAFHDGRRYFLNLQRTNVSRLPGGYTYPINDSLLPSVQINGETIAIDATEPARSRILWRRTMTQYSVLHLPEFQLPFLVFVGRLQNRVNNRTQQTLRILAIDAETGAILGQQDSIPNDRLLKQTYRRDASELTIGGANVGVTLKFAPVRVPETDEVVQVPGEPDSTP